MKAAIYLHLNLNPLMFVASILIWLFVMKKIIKCDKVLYDYSKPFMQE